MDEGGYFHNPHAHVVKGEEQKEMNRVAAELKNWRKIGEDWRKIGEELCELKKGPK